MTRTAITLDNVSIGYSAGKRQRVVARALSASVGGGRLTGMIGNNGTGKSTLLKTLAAFIPPLGGDILIGGKEIGSLSPKDIASTIGIVLTEKTDTGNLTAEELVAMGRYPFTGFMGFLSDEDKRITSEAMSIVGIDDLRGRKIATLSDGERQKVMIAKVIAQQTPVILLDEPTVYLDFGSKVELMKLLGRLAHDEDKTILFSTHDLELAMRMCDDILLLDREKGLDSIDKTELGRWIRRFY